MGQVAAHQVDLNAIEGDGTFLCPSCGETISPEDESESTYEIIDITTQEDGSLMTLTIRCKKCDSTTVVEGFEALDDLESSDDDDL